MLKMFDAVWFLSAIAILFVMTLLPAVAAIGCADVGAEPGCVGPARRRGCRRGVE